MRRHELTDTEWKLIEPLLPRNEGRGRPWRDHRTVINGIFWILNTGATWRDLPERYGAWQTAYDRFRYWQRNGTWNKLLRALRVRYDKKEGMIWESLEMNTSILTRGRADSLKESPSPGDRRDVP